MWRLSITLDSVGAREGFVLYNVEFIEELMHMACGFFYKELNFAIITWKIKVVFNSFN